jgi:DNA-binding transcriptional regulator YhcF (GntR family)
MQPGGMSVRKTAAKFEVNPSTVQRIARPFRGAEDAGVAA